MNWQNILLSLPGIILGLTFHEFCHAMAAYKLGDTTARDQGRLSFNPLKHIDPIGFLFIVVAGFGWAKPVQFNPQNLRHYRRDKALIAAAGPLANFLLAMILILLVKGYMSLDNHFYISENWNAFYFMNSNAVYYVVYVIIEAILINLGLFVFNLIPLPPLDGSHIFLSWLNLKPETEAQIMKIGAPLLFIIILVQNFANIQILPIGKLTMAILYFFIPEYKPV